MGFLGKLHQFKMSGVEFLIQIHLQYEFHQISLADKYAKCNQYIAGEELIKIIQQISQALRFLYNNSIKHGCINLNTILCCEKGYKITDVSSTNLSLMQLTQKGSKNQPISRKIIKFINEITVKAIIIKQMAVDDDLFSLGMIILSLGTNTQIGKFYNYRKIDEKLQIQLREQVIEDYLYLLKKRYSKNLYITVKRLISYQSNRYTNQLSLSMQIIQNKSIEAAQVKTQKGFNCSIQC